MIGQLCSVVAVVHELEPGATVRGVDVISNLAKLDAMARRLKVRPEVLHDILVRKAFPDAVEVWYVGRLRYWESIAQVHALRHWDQ